MAEIVEGLDGAERDRIGELRRGGRFFWIDVSLSEASPDELPDVLGIPERALQSLLGFGDDRPYSRRFYGDGTHVVFGSSCYLESNQLADGAPYRFRAAEVHVLVCGEYMLTLHEQPVSLPGLLAFDTPERRSEQYLVYSILDAMVGSAFDALNEVELGLDDLAVRASDLRAGRVRMASLRSISGRLSRMRRRVGA